jgi:hypothetical protein
VNVLMELLRDAATIDPDHIFGSVGPLIMLDAAAIYGPRIWALYAYQCERHVSRLVGLLRANQVGILSAEDLRRLSQTDPPLPDLPLVERTLEVVKRRLPNLQID